MIAHRINVWWLPSGAVVLDNETLGLRYVWLRPALKHVTLSGYGIREIWNE